MCVYIYIYSIYKKRKKETDGPPSLLNGADVYLMVCWWPTEATGPVTTSMTSDYFAPSGGPLTNFLPPRDLIQLLKMVPAGNDVGELWPTLRCNTKRPLELITRGQMLCLFASIDTFKHSQLFFSPLFKQFSKNKSVYVFRSHSTRQLAEIKRIPPLSPQWIKCRRFRSIKHVAYRFLIHWTNIRCPFFEMFQEVKLEAVTAEVTEEAEVTAVRCSVHASRRRKSASRGRPSPITKSLNWKRGSSIRSTCHLPTAMR